METSPRSAPRLTSPLALLLVCLAPLGCYKPAIVDGGLKCNFTAGAKPCPDDFSCELSSQTCKRHPSDGGSPMDAVDATDGSGDADAPICLFQPKAGCSPSASGLCDPACQTGCNCRDKCSVNTAGTLTCNPPHAQGFPRGLMQDCTIESAGAGVQTDNCGGGLVCIEDGCFARCFQFCKNDGDCTNATCTRDVGGGQKVCDVPFVDTCTPLGSTLNAGCTGTNMACYISSVSPAHTICDCPMNAGGANSDCTRTRDCFPGLACVDRQTGATPKCLQVCRLSNNGSDCPAMTPGSCHPYSGIPAGGTANPTYGYCF